MRGTSTLNSLKPSASKYSADFIRLYMIQNDFIDVGVTGPQLIESRTHNFMQHLIISFMIKLLTQCQSNVTCF